MTSLSIIASILFSYLVWAVILSDSLFHRVWSLALFLLLVLPTLVFSLPFGGLTIFLCVLVVLDFALCVALSPAQAVFSRLGTIDLDRKAMEIFYPKSNSLDSNGSSQETVLAEFVLPLLY